MKMFTCTAVVPDDGRHDVRYELRVEDGNEVVTTTLLPVWTMHQMGARVDLGRPQEYDVRIDREPILDEDPDYYENLLAEMGLS